MDKQTVTWFVVSEIGGKRLFKKKNGGKPVRYVTDFRTLRWVQR